MLPDSPRTLLPAIALVLGLVSVAPAQARNGGFYQKPGDATVYQVGHRGICAVTGPGQLKVLGGAGRVQRAGPDLVPQLDRGRVGNCPWPDGFYRRGHDRTVYLVARGNVCGVVGGGQLEALGGEGRVMTVGPDADLRAGKRDLGSCPWPNGFYRYPNSPQVYRIDGATICALRSEHQLKQYGGKDRVQTVGTQARLEANKRDIGACP